MKQLRNILLCCLLTSAASAVAQPILKCTEYKSGDVMNNSRVAAYVQDSKGIMWFGTWIGLCRYDGKEFRNFRPDITEVPLGSNRILKLALDSHEDLWSLNYDNGLYKFDRDHSSYQSLAPLVADKAEGTGFKDRPYPLTRHHVMWSLMTDGTLVRFNDHNPSENETVPCPSGRTDRTVYDIVEDSHDREWILTDHGVLLYGKGQVTDYPYERMVEMKGKCVFASQSSANMAIYLAEKAFEPISLPSEVHKILSLQPLSDGRLAVGSDAGLLIYDIEKNAFLTINKTDRGHAIHDVTKIYEDGKDWIWFLGTDRGLYCLQPGEEKAKFLVEPEPFDPVTAAKGRISLIMQDGYGELWMKSLKGDLCWVDVDNLVLHHYKECVSDGKKLPISNPNGLFIDHQNNLWVRSGNRLYHLTFERRQFHPIYTEPGVAVRALLPIDNHRLWVGDKHGCLCLCDLKSGKLQYLDAQGNLTNHHTVFNSAGVYCLMTDADNNLWVGTRGKGIYKLSPRGAGFDIAHYYNGHRPYDLNCDQIYDFCLDEYNRLWIATFGGGINLLLPQKEGTPRFLHAGNELQQYPLEEFDLVRSLATDGQGRILAGTSRGMLAFSSHFNQVSEVKFRPYQSQSKQSKPLADNMVMRVMYDDKGTAYVSTFAQGLCRITTPGLDSLEFEHLPNKDYPAGDVCLTAGVNSQGKVWNIAECGISCFDPSNNSMLYFDEHDFDRPYALTECAPVEMPDGRLVLGMIDGILTFWPDSLRKSSFAPRIAFMERLYALEANVFQEDINDLDTLIVNTEGRSACLRFAATDFVPSRMIRYAYWMHSEPDDENPKWVYTNLPDVNFTDIQPGKYHLHIRSTNSDGVWCDNERVFTLIVPPTFWERWGRLIIILLVASLSGAILLCYLRRLRRQQDEAVHHEVSAAKIEMLASPMDNSDQEFIQKLMQILESHLSDGELQVNDLADEMNMSRATLYRRLKQSVDLSPNDFVHQVRMRRSAELLTQTNDSIAQIAYSVGFNNPKYFSKCFRQDYGASPAEYRAKFKNSEEEAQEYHRPKPIVN